METRKVLVVEDEKNIRDLVCLHLGVEGYECLPVADGKEAMLIASEKPFDLIILDLMLPSMDGVTITRAIRRHGPNRDAPILMLTARREEADKVMGLDSGADDYLTKPFGVRELIARAAALMRRARAPLTAADGDGRPISIRGVELDPSRRGVRVRGAAGRRHAPGVQPALRAGVEPRHRVYARAAALARVAGAVVRHRPQRRHAGEAASQEDRNRSGRSAADPDGLGRRLQVRRCLSGIRASTGESRSASCCFLRRCSRCRAARSCTSSPRMEVAPGPTPPEVTRLVARDLSDALTANPALDIQQFFRQEYEGRVPLVAIMKDGRVFSTDGTKPSDAFVQDVRARLNADPESFMRGTWRAWTRRSVRGRCGRTATFRRGSVSRRSVGSRAGPRWGRSSSTACPWAS